MTEYQIQPNTRRCAGSGRDLTPGETFFSVLIDEGDHFLRKDYSREAWQGPPADAFCFWSGKVPAPDDDHRPRFDDELLVDCFHRLEGEREPRKISFRYVVALLLMRRKRLKFDRTKTEGGQEIICLRCGKTGATYQVINPRLAESDLTNAQEDVFEALGWS